MSPSDPESGPGEVTDEMVTAKWMELAPLIDLVMGRLQDPDDFVVQPASNLADDDKASSPYQLSHCARWCLHSGIEHLHALKSLIIDGGVIHSASPYSLVRGALENFGAGFWLLHSPDKSVRIERGLRWWAKNFKDQDKATRDLPSLHTPLEPKLLKLESIAQAANCDSTQIRNGYYSTDVLKYADQHSSADQPYLVWQLCSGFAHGRPWASLGMNERDTTPTSDDGVVLLRLTSDYKRLLFVTLPAVHLMTDFMRLYQENSVTD